MGKRRWDLQWWVPLSMWEVSYWRRRSAIMYLPTLRREVQVGPLRLRVWSDATLANRRWFTARWCPSKWLWRDEP